MNIILLSGGSGKRLWSLSNEVRSKQFLKIFKKADGSHESMLQRMFRMLHDVAPDASITIATSENQVTSINAQLRETVGISIEPCRRDTFPAIEVCEKYGLNIDKTRKKTLALLVWIAKYKKDGEAAFSKQRKFYSAELKRKAVSDYLR